MYVNVEESRARSDGGYQGHIDELWRLAEEKYDSMTKHILVLTIILELETTSIEFG